MYVFSYKSLCIYAFYAAADIFLIQVYASYASYVSYAAVYKLVYISYTSLSMHPMLHDIYEYLTLTIYKMYISLCIYASYAFKKGYYYSYGLILDL